ncbi:MAG: hypothetical protein V4451_06490 [Pseudomonadota bacterium]
MNPATARIAAVLSASLLAACAGPGSQPEAPFYRCEAGVDFRARFIDNSVALDGSRGHDVLYRDAGGTGEQAFYSNPRMKAEFGLGPTGREAILRYLLVPLVVRCVRE